jgi:2-methylaconitate cis-trans-isomerase PrpF
MPLVDKLAVWEKNPMPDLVPIQATLFRGGTSKGPLFLASDLPRDKDKLDAVLLAAMGSPHKRQVDGIGGAESLTSKVVIVSRSARNDADVDYLFAQVNPESPLVDYKSNCGNMLSAIAPFAVENGLVAANGHKTMVRIYNINTDSVVESTIETENGQVCYEGDAAIDGVPGTAAPVIENFAKTVGSKTKKLLPTGHVTEMIDGVEVTCIDVAVPTVMMEAVSIGIEGDEPKADLDSRPELIARLNRIRVDAGQRMGMGDCTDYVVPKPLVISRPRNGGTITSRDFVPYNCHATHSVSGATALAAACVLPGTLANRIAHVPLNSLTTVAIEHPGGRMDMDVEATLNNGTFILTQANLLRTTRRLFSGTVFIPSRIWDGCNKATDVADISKSIEF